MRKYKQKCQCEYNVKQKNIQKNVTVNIQESGKKWTAKRMHIVYLLLQLHNFIQ